MKHSHIFFILAFSSCLSGQGIDFFNGTWEEAMKKATAEDKLIFVDGYASWCGPCKKMARDVFPKEEVGSYFNENFVNMKIDMEKDQGVDFRRKYPVRAFPTLFFIDASGKTVLKDVGAKRSEDLISMAKSAVGKSNKSLSYLKKYEEGDRSYKTMYNLVKHLNKAGKPSLNISNEYLDTQSDYSSEENLKFILEATTEADSRVFDLLLKYEEEIKAQEGDGKFNHKVYDAGMRTALIAAEFENKDLFKSNEQIILKTIPERALDFQLYSSLNFYKAMNDENSFLKIAKKYYKKKIGKNIFDTHALTKNIFQQWSDSKELMAFSEKLAKQASEIGGTATYSVTYAKILKHNGKHAEAIKELHLAKKLAEKTNANVKNIQKIIDAWESDH